MKCQNFLVQKEQNKFQVSFLPLDKRIENDFTFHPSTPDTGVKHDTVRVFLKGAAHTLKSIVPEGRELSLALTALEEVMMWSNAGIARKE